MGSNLKSQTLESTMTGLIWDRRMLEHKCLWDDHPERPERIISIIARCEELGLLDRCQILESRKASEAEIATVHSPQQFEKLGKICCNADEGYVKLEAAASNYDSVYFHPSTNESALLACGSTIDLTQNILDGKVRNGMAIIRPPGHHAMKSAFSGYCFFNNVATAARLALDSGKAKRILIVDWDVHHGQGTQQMFYNDPRVLYFSTHRYENGQFWPNLKESNYNWIGEGKGTGFNCNIPLNKTGMGNTEFLTTWHQILLPLAYQYNPDLVLISAGFDSALNDPKGGMRLTPQCYPHLLSPLMGLADGKVAVILEGGYCLKALAEGAALTLRTLLGDPCPSVQPISDPMPELVETVLNSMTVLRRQWSLGANESRKNKDDVHVPTLIYDWTGVQLDKFSTKAENPVHSFEQCSQFDDALNQLIETANLSVPSTKVGIAFSAAPNIETKGRQFFGGIGIGLIEEPLKLPGPFGLMEAMVVGQCSSGIAIVSQHEAVETCKFAMDQHKFERILLVDWSMNGIAKEVFLRESKVLYVSMRSHISSETEINFRWEENEPSDADYLAAHTSVILPIAYEQSPDLIVVIGPDDHDVNPAIFVHSLHLLKALANGRVLLSLNSVHSEYCQPSFGLLLGRPPSRLSIKNLELETVGVAKGISQTAELLSGKWSTLRPFLKPLPHHSSIPVGRHEDNKIII